MEEINNMIPPTNQQGIHKFIGLVNCYQNIWERLQHMLEPLTILTPNEVK